MVDPDAAGIAPTPDPWGDDLQVDVDDPGARREAGGRLVDGWLTRMATTDRPLEEAMAWFWHDHFATSVQVVRAPVLMAEQIRTFWRLGLGSFRDLLRAVTIDGAMLRYLNGAESTAEAPNENYGRELLELFTLGVGEYDEADVAAGAAALTGWLVTARGDVRFIERRHDDGPQRYLGVDGVHDVDSVVDAVCAHDALAPFIAGKVARWFLGDGAVDDDLVADLARTFRDADLEMAPLVRATLQAGLDGRTSEVAAAPVPWLVGAVRALDVDLPLTARVRLGLLLDCGQVPTAPPSVAGWPGGAAWFSTGALVSRRTLASALAESGREGALDAAARAGDLDALADGLGRPEGFRPSTLDALAEAPADARLALALVSPDLLLR